jgi:hypothetical protein
LTSAAAEQEEARSWHSFDEPLWVQKKCGVLMLLIMLMLMLILMSMLMLMLMLQLLLLLDANADADSDNDDDEGDDDDDDNDAPLTMPRMSVCVASAGDSVAFRRDSLRLLTSFRDIKQSIEVHHLLRATEHFRLT